MLEWINTIKYVDKLINSRRALTLEDNMIKEIQKRLNGCNTIKIEEYDTHEYFRDSETGDWVHGDGSAFKNDTEMALYICKFHQEDFNIRVSYLDYDRCEEHSSYEGTCPYCNKGGGAWDDSDWANFFRS